MTNAPENVTDTNHTFKTVIQWLTIAVLVYLLISSVGMIGAGFKGATKVCNQSFHGSYYRYSGDGDDTVIFNGYVDYCWTCSRRASR